MKLIHMSDLHLGKRLHEFSLLEDQEYILTQALELIQKEQAELVLLAGDIYDKSIPSGEAMQLFDGFLTKLANMGVTVIAISGNHDSPERVAYGGNLFRRHGVHMSPVFQGDLKPVVVEDAHGPVHIYSLPFVKPPVVRKAYPDREITTYQQAVKTVVDEIPLQPEVRNILISHQFVTGAVTCDSEDLSVGGVDNVDAEVFQSFDYVALGHLHSPQSIGRDSIRYCGSPLKYSVSESSHTKSLTVVHLGPKGTMEITNVPLKPLRDLRKIKGTYMELTARENYKDSNLEDYVHATLTDEQDVMDAMAKLRTIYPNIISLEYENTRTRSHQQVGAPEEVESKSPLVLFEDFYQVQNNQPMNQEQRAFVQNLVEEIWGELK